MKNNSNALNWRLRNANNFNCCPYFYNFGGNRCNCDKDQKEEQIETVNFCTFNNE